MSYTWGDVVESDEIQSAKTGKWYEVTSSVRLKNGKMRVIAVGLPKAIDQPAGKPVTLRRGKTGEAVDMFTRVFWSGPSNPDVSKGAVGVAPLIESEEE